MTHEEAIRRLVPLMEWAGKAKEYSAYWTGRATSKEIYSLAKDLIAMLQAEEDDGK